MRRVIRGPSADVLLPWRVEINPLVNAVITAGTWAGYLAPGVASVAGMRYNDSNTQGDQIGWDVTLGAGTWAIDLFHYTEANRAIYTFALDGVTVGTVDGYGSATPYVRSAVTGITVATTGKKRLTVTAATRNASSSGWLVTIEAFGLRRTA